MVKPFLEEQKPGELLEQDKQRAREQWNQDPCGAEGDREHEFCTREYFDEIERVRYQEYAPWMPNLMGFTEFGGARLLEVGCGMGTDLLQFARGGAVCTGIDLTPRSIAITRHRFTLYGERADLLIGDGEIYLSRTRVFMLFTQMGFCTTHLIPAAQFARFTVYLSPVGLRR